MNIQYPMLDQACQAIFEKMLTVLHQSVLDGDAHAIDRFENGLRALEKTRSMARSSIDKWCEIG
jgi:hypothetical protein